MKAFAHVFTILVVSSLLVSGCGAAPAATPAVVQPTQPAPTSAPLATATSIPSVVQPTVPPTGTAEFAYGPEVVDVIPIASAAHGVAVGFGSVWVTGHHSDQVFRVNPATGEIEAKIPVGHGPGPISVAEDALWIADYGTSAETTGLTRIDPATNQAVAFVKPPDLCCNMVVGDRHLWFMDALGSVHGVSFADDSLDRSFAVPARTPVGGLMEGGGRLWGGGSRSNEVWGLDVATGEVVIVTVPGGTPIAVEGNLLWGAARNTLWAVDLSSLTLAFEVPGGETVYRFLDVGAAGDGVVWLAAQTYFGNEIKTVLLSVDTTTRAITRRIVIGPSPNRVAVGEGAVWVTDIDQSVLLKIVP